MKDFDLEKERAECAAAMEVLELLRVACCDLKAGIAEVDYQLWAADERRVDEAADRLAVVSKPSPG